MEGGNSVYLKTAVCHFMVARGENAVKCLCVAGLDNGCRDRYAKKTKMQTEQCIL